MKILILADSASNPRSFPDSEKTFLEETYPYILRKEFIDSTFWQLSFGNITSEELCSQAIGYLSDWDPDIIIVHSGVNDCRPEPMTKSQSTFFKFLTLGLIYRVSFLRDFIYSPYIIKKMGKSRVVDKSFKKTLKRLKLVFSDSKIYWLEIVAHKDYEEDRPGFIKKATSYNKLIKEVYLDDMVLTRQLIEGVDGFNMDNLHWRKNAHEVVSKAIINRIYKDFNLFNLGVKP